jgi:hypothetical protein
MQPMAHLHGKIVKFLQINFGIQIIFGIFADNNQEQSTILTIKFFRKRK